MGNKGNKKQQIKEFINYHCEKCGEIPLINFFIYKFDMACSNHKILNIPIKDFYKYITFNYKCSLCKENMNNKSGNNIYCFDCNKDYCNKCLENHKQDINNAHLTIRIEERNIMCKLHKKNYNAFCLKCKQNICEFCKNHDNHFIEMFQDLYPLEEDIKQFIKISSKNQLINEQKEMIKIKMQIVNSFSKNIYNYYYINTINNIIRCIYSKNNNENINKCIRKSKEDIIYINDMKLNYDINNIERKNAIKSIDVNYSNNYSSSCWCMKKLNDIQINPHKKLELIALGLSNSTIIIINTVNFKIYQTIKEHSSSVYSLEQYKDDSTFLFSSSNDASVNVYKLNNNNNYELIQKLNKSEEKSGGEINKVIALSNKFLVTGDHKTITIWESNNHNKNKIYFMDFYEIMINHDTCHLLEVNPLIFVATQYTGNHFQVYKNDGISFPLIGELVNVQTHGSSSNALSKINDHLVCSCGYNKFYIICIQPLQIIQIFPFAFNNTIYYSYATKDNYLYISGQYQEILQYKIIKDEDDNFVEIIEIGKYDNMIKENTYNKAILPFDDGRIFFIEEKEGLNQYILIA